MAIPVLEAAELNTLYDLAILSPDRVASSRITKNGRPFKIVVQVNEDGSFSVRAIFHDQ